MNLPCCRNCLMRHKKRKDGDSPRLSSFFKIMFGMKFNQYLVLPPAISKMLVSSVGRRIILEDSNRLKWDVLLTDKNGSLTFKRGWQNFVLDHNIEMGDLLMFHYHKNEHLLVEIYGRSGCPKILNVKQTDISRTSDTSTRDSIPAKRPSDYLYKQSAWKKPRHVLNVNDPSVKSRHVPTRGNFRERTSVVDPCSMTHQGKHGPKMVTDDEIMTNQDKCSPKVVPVSEPQVDPCFLNNQNKTRPEVVPVAKNVLDPRFMNSRDKNKPKVVPVIETLVDPYFTTGREKNRPEVVPVAETLVNPCFMMGREKSRPKVVPVAETPVDPCFMTGRDKNTVVQDDRDLLFDLSRFEMPDKKSTIDKEKETDYVHDLPAYDLPENENDANLTDELQLEGNMCSKVSGTFQNAATEIGDEKTTIDNDDMSDYLADMPDLVVPENEFTNASDKGQLHGMSDKYQHADNEAASTDFQNIQISEKNTEDVPSELLKPECVSSSSLKVDLPVDSILTPEIIGKPEVSQISAQSSSCEKMQLSNQETNVEGESSLGMHDQNSGDLGNSSIHPMTVEGEKMQLNNQEVKVRNQEFRGNAEGESSFGTKISMGEKMQPNNQEAKVRNQEFYGTAGGESSFGTKFSVGEQLNNQEAKVHNQEFLGFCPVKIEGQVNRIVKEEPVDYDAPPAIAAEVKCLVPSEDFLELPEPLNVVVGVSRYSRRYKQLQQQLVVLRDHAGKHWPVLYHPKNNFHVLTSGWKIFMKANNIQPGDECIFRVENLEENVFNVQVVRHN